MPLIAVRVAVLRRQIGDLRVAEGERIALVVVIRLVLRVRVENLELHAMRRTLGKAQRDAVVEAARGRFNRGQSVDAVRSARRQARAPWRSEERIVAVDEPSDVITLRVVVLHQCGEIRNDFLLPGDAGRLRARILKVAIEDENVGKEWSADLRLRNQIGIGRYRTENACESAVAEERLAARAVGRPRRRQGQSRHAAVVDAGVGAQH